MREYKPRPAPAHACFVFYVSSDQPTIFRIYRRRIPIVPRCGAYVSELLLLLRPHGGLRVALNAPIVRRRSNQTEPLCSFGLSRLALQPLGHREQDTIGFFATVGRMARRPSKEFRPPAGGTRCSGGCEAHPALQPEAIGAVMEVTKWLKPSISGHCASVQAATRVNAE